jgi:hypothetical protein
MKIRKKDSGKNIKYLDYPWVLLEGLTFRVIVNPMCGSVKHGVSPHDGRYIFEILDGCDALGTQRWRMLLTTDNPNNTMIIALNLAEALEKEKAKFDDT